MTYQYLRLGSDDLQPLRDLLQVFAEAFEEHGTYLSAQPRDSYLRNLLGQNNFIAMTAVSGQEVVGGLTAYVLQKFEQERSEIYVYDLAVARAHRRRGVATALIRYLHDVARSYVAWVMFVQADLGDEPAIRLYESLGRRENVYHFDIPVS
jgi:aminoglycoside 3-N-acetyltransferase I